MNRIFKTVWNTFRGCLVVVNEATNSASQRKSFGSIVGDTTPLVPKRMVKAIAFALASFTPLCSMAAYVNYVPDGLVVTDKALYGEHNSTLNLGGTFTVQSTGAMRLITGAIATFHIDSNEVINNYGRILIDSWGQKKNPGHHGYIKMSGGATINNYAGGHLIIGSNKTWANEIGGNVNSFVPSNMTFADATINNQGLFVSGMPIQVSSGNINNNGQWSNVGNFTLGGGTWAGSGDLTQSDGTFLVSGGSFRNTNLTLAGGTFSSTSSATLAVGRKTGSLSVQNLYLNGGALSGVQTLSQNAGIVAVNSGHYDIGALVQTNGSLTVKGSLAVGGANIASSGSFVNTGTVSFNGTSKIDKVISGTGLINVNGGTFNSVNINGASGLNVGSGTSSAYIGSLATNAITNASTLTIGTLAKNENVTYTQNGGTIKVNNQWFDNSTLNLNGGTLSIADLGANTVNLNGATVGLNSLNSQSSLTMTNGQLTIGDFQLSSGKTYRQTGGTLKTAATEVFASLGEGANDTLHVIGLNAQQPEAVQEKLTELFQFYVAGYVDQNFANHVTLNGGKIVVDGTGLTITQRDDLLQAFKDVFLAA